jgi:plasmid stability protein
MATLYVENVPDDLYEALRGRAKQHRKSIAAEVIALLGETVVTEQEAKARQQFLRRIRHFRSRRPASKGPFPTTEELQRHDRER